VSTHDLVLSGAQEPSTIATSGERKRICSTVAVRVPPPDLSICTRKSSIAYGPRIICPPTLTAGAHRDGSQPGTQHANVVRLFHPLLRTGLSRRTLCLFLPLCHRPSTTGVWVGLSLLPATTTFHGALSGTADIPLCSGPPSLLTSQILPTLRILHRAAEVSKSAPIVLRWLRTHRICKPSEYRQNTDN
jgi:hypothetical protein